MVTTKKATGKAISIPGGIATGTLASLCVTIVLSALIAKLVDSEAMAENAIGYGALITLLTATMAGSILAVSRIKRQRLLVSLLSGAVYYIMLLSITALFFGGQYQGMGITALVIAGGSAAVALMGLRQGRGKGSASRKWVHR